MIKLTRVKRLERHRKRKRGEDRERIWKDKTKPIGED